MNKIISIVDYIHELKEAGFTDKQAEVQAKKLEQIVSEVEAKIKEDIKSQELATKRDLLETEVRILNTTKRDLLETELRLLKWLIGIGLSVVITIGGMIAKGFHWL
jgi:hypothetical protein